MFPLPSLIGLRTSILLQLGMVCERKWVSASVENTHTVKSSQKLTQCWPQEKIVESRISGFLQLVPHSTVCFRVFFFTKLKVNVFKVGCQKLGTYIHVGIYINSLSYCSSEHPPFPFTCMGSKDAQRLINLLI